MPSTLIGTLGASLGPSSATSLSVGSATLYFADNSALYSVNAQSGAATQIGMTNSVIGGMVFENGTLYAGVNSCGGGACVWTVNPGSGTGTFVANASASSTGFAGLAPITPATSPQVLPQLAFGAGWYSALYFTNTSGAPVSFTVSFFSDNGTALTIPAIGGSSTTVNLLPQATTFLEAANVGSLTQGYVTASLPAGVIGYGVFRQSVPGTPDQEAVVPLSSANATSATIIWDDTGLATSVAIANPSAVAATVSVNVWDSFGNLLGTSSLQLGPGIKTEAELRSLPGLSAMLGRRGTARFSVNAGNIAVLGLRFNGAAFTSIPAVQQ